MNKNQSYERGMFIIMQHPFVLLLDAAATRKNESSGDGLYRGLPHAIYISYRYQYRKNRGEYFLMDRDEKENKKKSA